MSLPAATKACRATSKRGRLALCAQPTWNLTARHTQGLRLCRGLHRHHRRSVRLRQKLVVSAVTSISGGPQAKRRVVRFASLILHAQWQFSKKKTRLAISRKKASQGARKRAIGHAARDHTRHNQM